MRRILIPALAFLLAFAFSACMAPPKADEVTQAVNACSSICSTSGVRSFTAPIYGENACQVEKNTPYTCICGSPLSPSPAPSSTETPTLLPAEVPVAAGS